MPGSRVECMARVMAGGANPSENGIRSANNLVPDDHGYKLQAIKSLNMEGLFSNEPAHLG